MQDGKSDWMESLLRPSGTISAGAIFLGFWLIFLAIVNVAFGAFSEGNKVLWIDFLTNGEDSSAEWEFGFLLDDLVFTGFGLVVFIAGLFGMEKSREDGFMGWLKNVHHSAHFTSLISTDSGFGRTIGSWMILVGFGFYIIWSAMNNTWVDPGVYSVMIAFVSFGFGIHLIQESEATQ